MAVITERLEYDYGLRLLKDKPVDSEEFRRDLIVLAKLKMISDALKLVGDFMESGEWKASFLIKRND